MKQPAQPRTIPSEVRFSYQALPLELETTLFVFISALDVLMTTYLLTHHTNIIEANPVARYFISGWGLPGMVAFKLSLVTFVSFNCQIIFRVKPVTARRVMQFAVGTVSFVVLYSVALMTQL